MKAVDRPRASARIRIAAALLLSALLAACGGGGGGAAIAPVQPPAADPTVQAYDDPQAYSSLPDASLAGAVEAAAVSRHQVTIGAATIAYTARAGHLIARAPVTGAAQASMFYVAYTADAGAPAQRPVTFFFNGGPGSASVWLHLGSFGPRRIATGVPQTSLPRPFPLVANAESLLDTSDLVYVDAVGCGLSQAIAPFTNRSFWGVDADAGLFRDFIVRWLEVNGRQASPRFIYGESYGGPRAGVLARLLETAGVALTGVVLQSPAMDYNSNCGVGGGIGCATYLPTYAEIGAYHALVSPAAPDPDAYAVQMRSFTSEVYIPAVVGAVAFDANLAQRLAAATGLGFQFWLAQPNLPPGTFRSQLLPNEIIGRYDGRIRAANGSALAREGDPSSTLINDSFAIHIAGVLRDTLGYRNGTTYVLLSQAINFWDFSHGRRELPDTIPDLAEALRLNPRLRVLSVSGYHDLATPFHVTERDLARITAAPGRVEVRNYPGGHMTFLDDGTRARQKADLAAFYRAALAASAPSAAAEGRVRALAWRSQWPEGSPTRAGTLPTVPQTPIPQAAFQVPQLEPWVPPAQRPR